MKQQLKIATVVLNWNGEEDSLACVAALKKQTTSHQIIVVDNASTDKLVEKVKDKYPDIVILQNTKNLGFSGGVNTGIRYAMENNFDFVALINNDAKPESTWLEELLGVQHSTVQGQSLYSGVGIVTGKLLKTDGTVDSTGDFYTSWGLAYPRGRDENDKGQYEKVEEVFAASGGASLYSCKMLKEIGLFDEDFFAYYEDVDISFRAQLAGWKVLYAPKAVAYHKVGASSSKMKNGFTTYMTIKNLPWLFWKNVPFRLMPIILPRFIIAYLSFVSSAVVKGKSMSALKGLAVSILLMPKKTIERQEIQKNRKVSVSHIDSIIKKGLPPNAHKLVRVRKMVRTLMFKK